MNNKLIGAIIVIAVIGFFAFSFLSEKWRTEIDLSSDWTTLQTDLDELITGISEQLGVTQFAGEEFGAIIKDAIAAQPGNDEMGTNALFVSLQQAYPDIGADKLFDMAIDINTRIAGRRADYKLAQKKILDQAAEYEKSLTEPISMFFKMIGMLPSNNLQARTSRDNVVTGMTALIWIKTPIIGAGARESFETGEMQQVIPFNPNPQPTAAR